MLFYRPFNCETTHMYTLTGTAWSVFICWNGFLSPRKVWHHQNHFLPMGRFTGNRFLFTVERDLY